MGGLGLGGSRMAMPPSSIFGNPSNPYPYSSLKTVNKEITDFYLIKIMEVGTEVSIFILSKNLIPSLF